MFAHIRFKDGSNPYIAKTNKAFFEMLIAYNLTQESEFGFIASEKSTISKGYSNRKDALRDFAIDWQNGEFDYSYADLMNWQDFFTEYGKKFGLLREFHENAIC